MNRQHCLLMTAVFLLYVLTVYNLAGQIDKVKQDAADARPLLETSIEGARGVLINVTGGADLGLYEVHEAAEIVGSFADPDADIFFGAAIDESLQDEVRVTVIATGFRQRQVGYQQALQEIGRSAYARGENLDDPAWSRIDGGEQSKDGGH